MQVMTSACYRSAFCRGATGSAAAVLCITSLTACTSTTHPTVDKSPTTSAVVTPTTSATFANTPAAAASSASTASSTSRTGSPECLTAEQALAVATRLPSASGGALDSRYGYACSGGWAYVNFHNTINGNHSTVDLQYVNGKWAIGNRLTACGNGPLSAPPAIKAYGCGN